MQETTKAVPRRKSDWRFANRWFVGRGIDIGCGPDPLKVADWPRVTEVVPYDTMYGHKDGQYLEEIPSASFDFVFSSHCLEHLHDPTKSLTNWLRVLKPGGFIVAAIPEEFYYEQGVWPSRYNPDHKSSFTLRLNPVLPGSYNVARMLLGIPADIELISLITNHWESSKLGTDQTDNSTSAECAVEFVLRKPNPDQIW